MSKDKKYTASSEQSPDMMHDPLLEEAILKQEVASLSEAELLQMANALTPEDQAAVDSLGSSEQFIGELLSSDAKRDATRGADSQEPAVDVQRETPTSRESVETIADRDNQRGVADEMAQVKANVDAFDELQSLGFYSRYKKTTELGRGGQGVVYLVEGEDAFCAARALKAFFPYANKDLAEFLSDMDRMRRIASLIHRQPHDDLVDIGWFGERGGVFTMMMQFIDGFDLRRLCQRELLPSLKA